MRIITPLISLSYRTGFSPVNAVESHTQNRALIENLIEEFIVIMEHTFYHKKYSKTWVNT